MYLRARKMSVTLQTWKRMALNGQFLFQYIQPSKFCKLCMTHIFASSQLKVIIGSLFSSGSPCITMQGKSFFSRRSQDVIMEMDFRSFFLEKGSLCLSRGKSRVSTLLYLKYSLKPRKNFGTVMDTAAIKHLSLSNFCQQCIVENYSRCN